MKLTKTQRAAMKMMSQGYKAGNIVGNAVDIDGAVVCGMSTIKALIKLGLVESCGRPSWYYQATEAGLAWRG